jgi:putative Ca2+/H+ antiporter (TMEM165/GDT1 family)
MVIGVIMGSGLWWLLLSTLVACIFRDKISANIMQKIKILSGAIILLFGVVSIISIFS